MGATPPPQITVTAQQPAYMTLMPYALAALIVVGVIVLLALGSISENAGVALLGLITGGHLVKLGNA